MKRKVLLISILIAAAAMVLVSTYPHIGADPDSTIYVSAAKNLLAGRGLTMPVVGTPLTHYPPFYPWVLSAGGLLGFNLLRWALIWDILLLMGNILLAGVIASRMGINRSILPMALVAFSPAILTVHWMVWSEPFLIFLGFAGLLGLDIYLETKRIALLWLAGLLMALAWLDRYIGLAFIASAVAGLWLFSRYRVRDVLLLSGISIFPMLAWLAHNLTLTGNPTNRIIALKALTVSAGVALVIELVMIIGLYALIRRSKAAALPHLLILTIFAYVAILGVTVCLVDPATPVLDTRIQVPVLYALLLLLPWLASLLHPRTGKIFHALLVTVVIVQLVGSIAYTSIAFTDGLAFSDGRWSQENLFIPAHPWQ